MFSPNSQLRRVVLGGLRQQGFVFFRHPRWTSVRKVSMIAACTKTRQIIGRDGGLPWQPPFGPGLPSDMQHFRETTRGGVLIVGRHTFGERGAPYDHARHTIVVSRDADGSIQDSGAVVVSSLDIAISTARQLLPEEEESNDPAHEPIWICGGQRVYEEAIKKRLAHTLWLTVVNHDFAGDRTFPPEDEWRDAFPVEVESPRSLDDNGITFCIYHLCTARQWLNNNLES